MTIPTIPVIYVYGIPGNLRYSLVRSPQWHTVREWFTTAGVTATWTPRLRGWCVRTERVGDVIAMAEAAGFGVKMKGALR